METKETKVTMNETLRQSSTLVEFHSTAWSGTKRDAEAATDVAVASNAKATAFKVTKDLLPDSPELKAVNRAIGAARAFVYDSTLPYSRESYGAKRGPRILPNALFFDFVEKLTGFRNGVTKSLDKLMVRYDERITEARVTLGTKFHPAEYPDVSVIRKMFDITVEFRPIPVGGDFSAMDPNVQRVLASNVEKRCDEAVVIAMREAWGRVTNVVTRLRDNLSKEAEEGGKKPAWHGTTITSVVDMCALMKHLNVTNDPHLESIRAEIERTITQHTVKELKEDDVLRRSVAAKADEILARMADIHKAA